MSVVTATRDGADLLPATIASVQAQTLDDWELVVVDDASTDDTPEVVDRFAAADRRIRLVRLDANVGSYAAATQGILASSGEYVARLDGDDLALPHRLELQVDALRRSPGLRVCAGGWRLLRADGSVEARVRTVPSSSNPVLRWRLFLRSGFVHSTLLLERAAFDELGGYGPERMAEDFRMWCRAVRRSWLAVVDEPLVHWRQHDRQVTSQPGARDDDARLRVRLDHLQACNPEGGWTLDDARDLRWLGERAPFAPRRATELLGRWERAWRGDTSLERDERTALGRFARGIALRHLKHNAPGAPVASLPLALSTARRAVAG